MNKIHFIAGMPRSGSTVLIALLNQNPRFSGAISGPLQSMVSGMLTTPQADPSLLTMLPREVCRRATRALAEAFYADVADKEVVFDVNRAWPFRTTLLADAFPASKLILCLRDVSEVCDSFERVARNSPYQASKIFGPRQTVYERFDLMMQPAGLITGPLDGMRQAFHSAERNMLYLVDYNGLCADPEGTLRRLYAFLGEPWFEHDFDKADSDWDAYDRALDTPGLHTTRAKLEKLDREPLLLPEMLAQASELTFWKRPEYVQLLKQHIAGAAEIDFGGTYTGWY